ncbi:MAG TPA: hypothetical protein VFL99_10350 [Segeticoccus sp.]|uniref:hypothetical protein n=1 Tax=Segeticoccus sp. TaxID=2706531 RepID=UPI002D7F6A3D|nr:hypothetical protein [Segeticoccus sp.]HET8600716.1 hypothetical protein [Segeticoccus sp.]
MSSADLSQGVGAVGRARVGVRTLRGGRDRWWLQPVLTVTGLSLWVIYAVVRTALQRNYWVADYHYLSPFYSPCLTTSCAPGSSHLGTPFGNFPPLLPYAILSLPFLLVFRLTCYYYRKAYYRSYYLAPPACAVAEPHRTYHGETRFPLILQNFHRWFFYAAVILSGINSYDAAVAFHGKGGGFGFGLGNLILIANVILLWCYTLGCHSCRNIVGGRLRHFSKHPIRYWAWGKVSLLNGRHMQFAWFTLLSLAVTDAYIAFVAAGVFPDPRFIN